MPKRRAFTLVELLVVISVVALLIAILLPSLRKAQNQAKRTACAANLRQIGVAFQSYLAESSDRYPYASFMPSTGPLPLETDDDEPIHIAEVLLIHVGGDPEVFHCPRDRAGVDRPEENAGQSYFESEKCSYEYRWHHPSLGGKTIKEVVEQLNRHSENRTVTDNSIWLMRDYDNFHGEGGKPGARRYLYSDGHVTDFEN